MRTGGRIVGRRLFVQDGLASADMKGHALLPSRARFVAGAALPVVGVGRLRSHNDRVIDWDRLQRGAVGLGLLRPSGVRLLEDLGEIDAVLLQEKTTSSLEAAFIHAPQRSLDDLAIPQTADGRVQHRPRRRGRRARR